VEAIYCHATSKDGAKADPAGEVRAESLAKAAASAGVKHIVYNSSGIACVHLGQSYTCHSSQGCFTLELTVTY
jgi:hypothetical protein